MGPTGVVTGEWGLAEAYRARKQALKEWLTDEREPVKAFAEDEIARLDRVIAAELRRAETRKEMRIRDYDDDNGKSDDDLGKEGEPVVR